MDRQSLDVDTLGGGRVRHALQMDRERGAGWMEGQDRPSEPRGGPSRLAAASLLPEPEVTGKVKSAMDLVPMCQASPG